MNVIVNGKQETLELVVNGVNCTQDIIGNHGALSDGQFTYDEDQDAYVCDQDTFDWWDRVLTDQQSLENRIAELKEEHGFEKVQGVLDRVGHYELEDIAAAVNKELDETFNTSYAIMNNDSSPGVDRILEHESHELQEGTEDEIKLLARESNLKFIHWYRRDEDNYNIAHYNYITTTGN